MGGHNRWVNNYCGNNTVCEPNAVLVNGLAALDANTGVGLAWWHPQTLRGAGTKYLSTFPAGTYDGSSAGLSLGNDTNYDGGAYHSYEAVFPIAAPTSGTPGGPIPSGEFVNEGGTGTGAPMCIDDAGDGSSTGTPVELNTCLNDAEQNWNIDSNGTIELNGLCLGLDGATTSGTPVALNTCNGGTTQQWSQGTREHARRLRVLPDRPGQREGRDAASDKDLRRHVEPGVAVAGGPGTTGTSCRRRDLFAGLAEEQRRALPRRQWRLGCDGQQGPDVGMHR